MEDESLVNDPSSEQKTREAMENLKPGMRFHDRHTYHIEVLAIEDEIIAVKEMPPPLGIDQEYRFFRNAAALQEAYKYPQGEYWVEYLDHGGSPWRKSLMALLVKATGRKAATAKNLEDMLEG